MSWVKNGLLLGAGGVIGLVIAAWLESEGNFDEYRSTLEKLLKDLENSKPAGDSENIKRMELPDGTTRTAVRAS